ERLVGSEMCIRDSHCAMPLLQRLEVPGALRVSLGLYNDADDLERFFLALDRSLELLR
ncbi:aminotransferase class V-fold PLP-dependent enzyme, partial [Pseudomonas aeruginosa]